VSTRQPLVLPPICIDTTAALAPSYVRVGTVIVIVGHGFGNAGMGYLVRAIRPDGVSGSFRAEKDTRSEALMLAKTLREEGFWVIVTGPDGETIEETADE
jgi:hypothetical protein